MKSRARGQKQERIMDLDFKSLLEDWRDLGFDAGFDEVSADGGAAYEEGGGVGAGAKEAGGRKALPPPPTPLVQLSTELWREKEVRLSELWRERE